MILFDFGKMFFITNLKTSCTKPCSVVYFQYTVAGQFLCMDLGGVDRCRQYEPLTEGSLFFVILSG